MVCLCCHLRYLLGCACADVRGDASVAAAGCLRVGVSAQKHRRLGYAGVQGQMVEGLE